MAGRHGNKGIVARIVRHEDMPSLKTERQLIYCVEPIMNIGQIYETVLVGLDKTWVENILQF
jgi:DNA-directed RNA polymerase subunit beta